ncbi:MAG TPA: MASE1 domain-containing protein [Gaiellaceae bacterium]|nr:MASE1 domain-containing protein [Gaiellaceae bacterium]
MSEFAYRESVDRPWLERLPHNPARYAAGVLALAGLYYAGAKTGYLLEFSGPVAAIVWLPVGIGISFLYLGGVVYWPGVLIGDLLANNYSVLPFGSALGQTCGNVLEVVIATLLIRRLIRHESPLATVRGIGVIAVSVAAGAAVSATIGATSSLSGGVIGLHELPKVWRTWWLGDASGALLVVPLALAWYAPLPKGWPRARWLEAGSLLLAVVALAEVATRSTTPIAYLVFPVLIWAALRFGQRGATLAVAVTAVVTVWNVTHYAGPFHFTSITRSVLSTQLFIAVAVLTTLSLAAAVTERERFALRLAASRLRLISASDNARRRIEHDLHDGAQLRLTWLAQQLHDSAETARREPARAAELLGAAEVELQLAIDELRELAHGIHPAVLVDFGLAEALKSLALRSSIPVKLAELPSTRLDSAAGTVGYYVVAEAIANAQKHSDASRIEVRASAARGVLRLEIADDGVGGAVEHSGSGLEGLRDRAEASGGMLEVVSPPGGGTRIRAEIPA